MQTYHRKKPVKTPPGKRHGRIILLSLMLAGCGQTQPLDRGLKSTERQDSENAESAKPTMTVEDVIHGFETADSLPEQSATDADRAAWLASLVPEDSMKPEDSSTSSAEFQLDASASDEREVVDLRPNDTAVRNQGSEGTCTAFATVATMENLVKRFYGQSIDISERHHWSTYADYQTTSSLKKASASAIVSEATWPYNGSRPRDVSGLGIAKLKKYSTTKLSLQPVVESLRKGQPVVIAVGVLTSLMNPKKGGIVQGGVQQGRTGHAIALTGAIIDARVPGGGYFIIKNSWGKNWGDKGYGYVAFDYCQRTWCSAYSIADTALIAAGAEVTKPGSDSFPTQPTTPPVTPQPVPTNGPIPPPAAVVTADDFRLVGHPSDRRGLFGMTSYYLTIEAKPEIMKQIKSIQYAPSEGSYFTVTNGSAEDVPVSAQNLASPDFRTRSKSVQTESVNVRLRDSTLIRLNGISIDL